MRPACEDRKRLIAEFQDALERFSAAVKHGRQCERDEHRFPDAYQATELARLHCEDARKMLERHRTEHGC